MVLLFVFGARVAYGAEQYLFVEDTTGEIFMGSTNNAKNHLQMSTNWFEGLNLENTNVVNNLAQLSRSSVDGLALDCNTNDVVIMGPGTCADSLNQKLLEISSPTNVTFSDLDTGVEAASTWYFIYLAETNDTTVTVLSTNQFTPVGYSVYRRVGTVYNDASSDFNQYDQVGQSRERTYTYKGTRADYQALNAGTSGTETLVNLDAFVPPTVEVAFLGIDFRADNGAAGDVGRIRHDTDDVWLEFSLGTKNTEYGKYTTRVVLDGDQSVFYQVTQNNKNDLSIFVTGYSEGI
jgi:hypothetical protein